MWALFVLSSSPLSCSVYKMQQLSEKQRRDLIVQYRIRHPVLSKYAIAVYFKEFGISKSTIYSVLSTYDNRGTTERADGSGTVAKKMPPKRVRALLNCVTNSSAPSQNLLARKYLISQQYVCKILRHNGLRSYKKQKAPAVTEKQRPLQKIRIDRLYRHILSGNAEPQIIMDDESYFTLSGSNIPQNDHYYADACGSAVNSIKLRRQAKFEHKLMVWITVSPAGISRPYFCPSGEALNAEVYQNKCILGRLLPFINLHHQDGQYLFWPDLASCHYARSTVSLLQQLGINVVAKEMNPPNCPQLRPIEEFWGMLKQLVYANGWSASNHQQLKRRIQLCLRKVDGNVVRQMMASVKSGIRKARAEGVDTLIH